MTQINTSRFPSELLDAYWHTTSVERYAGILESGSIKPEPENIGQRWGESLGPDYYPFVRTLKGVSIFDFNGFDPAEYSKCFPASSWRSFVPAGENSNNAIWIKLSPDNMPGDFLNGIQLKALQESKKAYKNKLMPRIECAHIGEIPVDRFVKVLRYDHENGFLELENSNV